MRGARPSEKPARRPDIVGPVKPPVDAAVRVGSHHGFATDTPILVQETNNTVVWLRPHAVIAKVGTRSHSTEALTGGAIGAPPATSAAETPCSRVERVAPIVDEETAFLVTLWRRLNRDDRDVSAENSARVLALLHEHLARYTGGVPSFRTSDGDPSGAAAGRIHVLEFDPLEQVVEEADAVGGFIDGA